MANYFTLFKRNFKVKNFITYFIIIFFTVLFGAISMGGGLERSTLVLFEKMGYSVILAISLSLVVGFLGELSLGHAAFMSLGAFIGGYVQTYMLKSLLDVSPLLSIVIAMIVGGLVAAVFGFLIGLPALRLKGDYLAIVTLAFGEIVKTIFMNSETFQGAMGLKTYRYNQDSLFIISFVVVLISLVLIQNLIRSKHGRAIMSVRDSEIAARSVGVNVTYYKLAVFVVSAFFAGVAGVIYSNANFRVAAATFDYNYSINILVMVVLGGMGNINGSILAAIAITFLNNKLATLLTGDLASLQNLFYALVLVIIVIYTNAPALKSFREKYNLSALYSWIKKKLFKSHKKQGNDVPSSEVDHGADWAKIPTKIEMDALLSTDIVPNPNGSPNPDSVPLDDGGNK